MTTWILEWFKLFDNVSKPSNVQWSDDRDEAIERETEEILNWIKNTLNWFWVSLPNDLSGWSQDDTVDDDGLNYDPAKLKKGTFTF